MPHTLPHREPTPVSPSGRGPWDKSKSFPEQPDRSDPPCHMSTSLISLSPLVFRCCLAHASCGFSNSNLTTLDLCKDPSRTDLSMVTNVFLYSLCWQWSLSTAALSWNVFKRNIVQRSSAGLADTPEAQSYDSSQSEGKRCWLTFRYSCRNRAQITNHNMLVHPDYSSQQVGAMLKC